MLKGSISCVADGPDSHKVKKERERVKVRVSIFFDGTLNNMSNVSYSKSKKSPYSEDIILKDIQEKFNDPDQYSSKYSSPSSYENDYSNIALLVRVVDTSKFEYHHCFEPIYREGIGTENSEEDSMLGYALGQSTTGVRAKVEKSIVEIMEVVKNRTDLASKKVIIDEFRFDVFGFSRGAAAARHFINQILNTTYFVTGGLAMIIKPLKERLNEQGFDIQQVKVHFAGLFDTVSSVGISGTALRLSNVKDLSLNAIGQATSVLHLVAADEHRKNFASTNIKSAPTGKELHLPGVHSDIGGGYSSPSFEHIKIYDTDDFFISEGDLEIIEADIEQLISEGWFDYSDLLHKDGRRCLLNFEKIREAVNWHGEVFVKRAGREYKGISNYYSRIPLHLMKLEAERNGMHFVKEKINNAPEMRLISDDPTLSQTYNLLEKYLDNPSNQEIWRSAPVLLELRRNYLHFSACCKKMLNSYAPDGPEYEGNIRKRRVHEG
ncbi:DUF2235 domain-containing protein [Dyadobacter sp. CY327]|uniref:phospholipase effector Tle1 domain-containing protein n=1 Tax=Dyadobacter sp. CY327 TaxID=2907301 RepID=UPI001F2626A5|nr:DUF2235 domain-containing protein [Dyadobacter sp. CY327]MCE7070779.1 DUF2235 domain-containing protein [Dyadobacter sp. CY327]